MTKPTPHEIYKRLDTLMTGRTTAQLIDMWEEANKEKTEHGRMVRGWICDALVTRNEAAFIEWSHAPGYPSPRAYFLKINE